MVAAGVETIADIRVRPVDHCASCGSTGTILYAGLRDRIHSVPGEWTVFRCSGCGLLWLNPMPLEADLAKLYPQDYATHRTDDPLPPFLRRREHAAIDEGYRARRWGYPASAGKKLLGLLVHLTPGRRADLDSSIMYLEARPGGRLLDVGCGNGTLLERMRRLGWQVEGVETDPEAVRRARARRLAVGLGAPADQGYADASFDAVVMSHVIEHVADPVSLLADCRRLLRPGGRLVMTTPNAASWGHRSCRAAWLHLDPPRHLRVFTSAALEPLASRAGFGTISTRTTGAFAAPALFASRVIRRHGRWKPSAGPRARFERTRARLLQLAECFALPLDRGAGEELLLLADK